MRNITAATLQALGIFLQDVILNHRLPVEWGNFLRDLSEGIKYTTMVAQRNYLLQLKKIGEATPEIQGLARAIRGFHGEQRCRA